IFFLSEVILKSCHFLWINYQGDLGGTLVDKYCNYCQREWSFGLEMMEVNAGNSRSNEKQQSECPKSADKGKKPAEKDASSSVFVNHAAIAWHENRRRWVGDKSQQSQRVSKDPVISWSTTYEELLLTNEPFPESISLPEMVDFLVDIWHDDGLFD
ncbi:Uncharacterized protein TCM_043308 isoform 2, partial [Theobroma cacao]